MEVFASFFKKKFFFEKKNQKTFTRLSGVALRHPGYPRQKKPRAFGL
jgi:hypothetical protein